MDPRDTVGWIYKEKCYTQNIKALGLVVQRRSFFHPHSKAIGANDPRGGAIFNPRDMNGWIFVELHMTFLPSKERSFGSCGFREEYFFMYFSL